MISKLQSTFQETPIAFLDEISVKFQTLTKRFAFFHLGFFFLFLLEVITILLFFPILAKNFLLAILVALTLLTAFSYFVLRLYFQSQKPKQFIHIRDYFILLCQPIYQENVPSIQKRELFLKLLYDLIFKLEGKEYEYYRLPFFDFAFGPPLKKLSAWFHWEDIHIMKELLHLYGIQMQMQWIKQNPTRPELHATLAKSYTRLYKIYQPSFTEENEYSFISQKYLSQSMTEKFQKRAQCAIEEWNVVLYYEPEQIEALTQMAEIYQDLNEQNKELEIYQKLVKLAPQNRDFQFHLAVLYFKTGLIAPGLEIYETLVQLLPDKAQELIELYDSSHSLEESF